MSKAEAGSPRRAKSPGDGAGDLLLIQRAAAGEQTALRELFERHHPRVFRFILRLARNEAEAEELSNEVFMEVWRNAPNFAQRSSVLTWILSIAHNRAVSALRPYAAVLVVASDEEFVPAMLHALRA